MTKEVSIQSYIKGDAVQKNIMETLGKKSAAFTSSVISIVSNSAKLKNAKPVSVLAAAMKAATLDLPIEPSLGFAYVVPYKSEAQFQLCYKGLIQLALRSGQFKNLNSGKVHEGQLISYNPLFEDLEIDYMKPSDTEVIGYFASMRLTNGFEKVVYWTKAQVEEHRDRFSKAKDFGPWVSDFDAMAQKTVLKSMLSKYAPLSIEMQDAIVSDNQTEDVKEAFADDKTSQQSLLDSIVSEAQTNEKEVEIVDAEEIKIDDPDVPDFLKE